MNELSIKKIISEYQPYKVTWKDRTRWYIQDLVQTVIPYSVRDYYWKNIRPVFKPQHSRIRKAVPKYWNDLDSILENVNFEIIKSFYEDEYLKDNVDWEGTGSEAAEFEKWLCEAYKYVTDDRLALEKAIDGAYPDENKDVNKTYKELYGKVDELEALKERQDTKYLTELIKYRHFLWT